MKIMVIRIRNLASLEGNTEIDFREEPLRSAGIFAITGRTGAGKSTILDALCLALYAKTPRYRMAENGIDVKDVRDSTIKQDDVRGILRDGTADGFAEVEFIGVDGQQYRSRWSVRRARNRVDGTLQAYDIQLSNSDINRDLPGRKSELLAEIERLIGLNFEQFTRSVLLAQGDFTAFLKADKDEKSSLLEKLTGTHIYSEISKRVFENHKIQIQKVKELSVRSEGIQVLTESASIALKEVLRSAEMELEQLGQQTALLGKQSLWYEQLAARSAEMDLAKTRQERATREKEAASDREIKFSQLLLAQEARPLLERIYQVRKELEDQTQGTRQVQREIEALRFSKVELETELAAAKKEVEDQQTARQLADPLLQSAARLDVRIAEKEQEVYRRNEEAAITRKQHRQQYDSILLHKREAEKRSLTIQQLSEWKERHSSRRVVAENESFILSRLKDAQALVDDRQLIMTKADRIVQSITQEEGGLSKLIEGEKKWREMHLETESQYLESRKKLRTRSSDKLEADKVQADAEVESLVSGGALWKLYAGVQSDKKQFHDQVDTLQERYRERIAEKVGTDEALTKSLVRRESSMVMLEKARLTVADRVEDLRSTLTPGDPCPVCGSHHHPYAAENPHLQAVLDDLESVFKEVDREHTDLLRKQSRLIQTVEDLKNQIDRNGNILKEKEEEEKELQQEWATSALNKVTKAIPIEKRSEWIHNRLQQVKLKQRDLEQAMRDDRSEREILTGLKESVELYEKKRAAAASALKDKEKQIQSYQVNLSESLAGEQKATSRIKEIRDELSAYFDSDNWFEGWQADSDLFVGKIISFSGQWREKNARLDKELRTEELEEVGLKEMSSRLAIIEVELAERIKRLSDLSEDLNTCVAERKRIFNGESIELILENLDKSLHQARQIFDVHEENHQTLLNRLLRIEAEKEHEENRQMQLEEQLLNAETKLSVWMEKHNAEIRNRLSRPEIEHLLSVDQGRIQHERESLKLIADELIKAKSVWLERNEDLKKHEQQRPPISPHELERKQEALKLKLGEANRKLSEANFKLNEDVLNRTRMGSILEEMEEQSRITDRWAKLNELVGSSDGKKFRQLAQEYTLDFLLSYSNVHLKFLSLRYVLQRIPNSLGLQVVDRDMGDEVRTVYSLSGGESFLVSLALALGLASLSSNRMKVESLFIDEGFGALDPDTLSIAMDALERLHNQGRKVGVISHVQEMTERIAVQIEVSKQHSGKSYVSVIG